MVKGEDIRKWLGAQSSCRSTTSLVPLPWGLMTDYGRFGNLAARHMARWRPSDWAAIPAQDRERYFLDLDEQVGQEISRRVAQFAPPKELQLTDFLQYQGQLKMAWHMAESEVLAEMVYLPPEPGLESEQDEPQMADNGGWTDPGWVSPWAQIMMAGEEDEES